MKQKNIFNWLKMGTFILDYDVKNYKKLTVAHTVNYCNTRTFKIYLLSKCQSALKICC